MRIRMVPISQIFSRFPRLVRDLSKSLSKKVNLVIEGEETELDKSVIEDLLDPLDAFRPQRPRSRRGELRMSARPPASPRRARSILRASNEGNMIVIEIADDGKGIDVDAVKRQGRGARPHPSQQGPHGARVLQPDLRGRVLHGRHGDEHLRPRRRPGRRQAADREAERLGDRDQPARQGHASSPSSCRSPWPSSRASSCASASETYSIPIT